RDAAQLGLPPQESGGVHGGAPDRLGGGHPAPDHADELRGVLAVGEDAGVGAEGDVDAGADGGFDPLGAMGVRGDLPARHGGRADDRPHLFLGELLGADGVAGREHAPGRADLDDVGAVLDLVPDRGHRLVHAVGDPLLDAAARVAVRAVAVGVAVPAGAADGEAGRDDARAWHQAVFDRVAERDVGPLVGADVADGGEAGQQRDARVLDADDGGVAGPLVQPVVAVSAAGVAVQVGVGVDEAGQHGVPGQVDHLGAARDVHVGTHRSDAFATH